MKNVLIIGTGTIGLPLIGLLARHKSKFGIGNVFFNKNTPLKNDAAQIKQLVGIGAKLVTDRDKFDGFRELGLNPVCTKEEVFDDVSVVVDCTPSGVGLQNKREYYNKYKDKIKGFIAQGSEYGFGKMYARGITDLSKDDQFVQVVSCNTHNIAAIIKSLDEPFSSVIPGGIFSGDFVCLRRSNDISQNDGFVPSIFVGEHNSGEFGTHHARDAHSLLKNQFPKTMLFSSAVKLNTQYMHTIRFSVHVDHIGQDRGSVDGVLKRFRDNPYVALTDKYTTNEVFSFGRDHGLYGRILSQTVIFAQTISVRPADRGHIITGLCATPQDGNSLLSSVSAVLHFIGPKTVEQKLKHYKPYIFQEI